MLNGSTGVFPGPGEVELDLLTPNWEQEVSVLSAKTRKLLSIGAGAWYTPRYRKYRKSFLPDRGIPSLLCM